MFIIILTRSTALATPDLASPDMDRVRRRPIKVPVIVPTVNLSQTVLVFPQLMLEMD